GPARGAADRLGRGSRRARCGGKRRGWPWSAAVYLQPPDVITFTSVDRPAIIARLGTSSNAMRTGTRWVTLTQLPVAFWAGSTENSLPVPAPIVWTWPRTTSPG